MYVLPRKILVALVGQGSHDMKPVMERKGEGQRQAKASGWRVNEREDLSTVQCKSKKKKRKTKEKKTTTMVLVQNTKKKEVL